MYSLKNACFKRFTAFRLCAHHTYRRILYRPAEGFRTYRKI